MNPFQLLGLPFPARTYPMPSGVDVLQLLNPRSTPDAELPNLKDRAALLRGLDHGGPALHAKAWWARRYTSGWSCSRISGSREMTCPESTTLEFSTLQEGQLRRP
jgi:hypothetical protein